MGNRIPAWAFDLALAAVLFAVSAFELAVLRPENWQWAVVINAVACGLLALRRRAPLIIGTAAPIVLFSTALLGEQANDAAAPILTLAVSIYTLARWCDDLRGLIGVGVIALAIFTDYRTVDTRVHDISDVFFVAALLVPPYVFGRLVRRLAAQKALLEEREELVTREAVRAERDRIARELHDVIAHSVSAMVVQTSAAQDLVRSDPHRAEGVLRDVADTGRRALVETGRLLHVIRDDAHELGLNPAPGVADLERLVQEFRAEGLEVDLSVDDGLAPLPAGIDVSAYRIAQEALTNALRYGGGTATLQVTGTGDGVAIHATNPAGPKRPSMGSGLGLRGLAERVNLLGGTLSHGNRDGHFVLAATLPLEQT